MKLETCCTCGAALGVEGEERFCQGVLREFHKKHVGAGCGETDKATARKQRSITEGEGSIWRTLAQTEATHSQLLLPIGAVLTP